MSSQRLFNGVDTIIIRVSDIRVSSEWYENMLGLTKIFEDNQSGLIVYDSGSSVSITLWALGSDEQLSENQMMRSFPIFKSSDAPADYDYLRREGVILEELVRTDSIIYFDFYDPDGNRLEACQVL